MRKFFKHNKRGGGNFKSVLAFFNLPTQISDFGHVCAMSLWSKQQHKIRNRFCEVEYELIPIWNRFYTGNCCPGSSSLSSTDVEGYACMDNWKNRGRPYRVHLLNSLFDLNYRYSEGQRFKMLNIGKHLATFIKGKVESLVLKIT